MASESSGFGVIECKRHKTHTIWRKVLYRRESYIHESRLLEPADWHRHPEESVEHLPTLGSLRSYPFASRVFKVSWLKKTEALKGVHGIVTSFGWGPSHRQNLDPPLFARNSSQYVRHSRIGSDRAFYHSFYGSWYWYQNNNGRDAISTMFLRSRRAWFRKTIRNKFESSWLQGRVRGSCLVLYICLKMWR
jgi:hypothetical protein